MPSPSLACVALSLSLSLSPASDIEPTAAERPYADRAAAKMEDGDWRGVAEILEEGYEVTGSLRLLAAWARAEKEAGDCTRSLEIYERFFAADPTPEQVQTVQPHVQACRDRLAREAELAPEPEPEPEPAPTPVDAPKRWPRDVLGGVLVGVGGALLVTGTGLAVAAELGDARVDAASTQGEFESQLQRAQRLAYASYAVFAVGGALAIGGVVRWAVVAKRSKQVSLAPLPGGGVVSLSGRFGWR